MKSLSGICGLALLAIGFAACDENSNIGSSIVSDEVSIIIDSLATVTASTTQSNSSIQSRTLTQLIGIIDSDDFGKMSSDVVTQFMPANELDTVGITPSCIDSLKIVMFMNKGAYVGDSIMPMGMNIYSLNRTLPSPIFSDFNPEGYYNPDDLLASVSYNAAALGVSDSLAALDYRTIEVPLPVELGRKLYTSYLENPASFSTPTDFAKIFPGIYIKNTYGSGRIVHVAQTIMRMYFRKYTTYTKDDVERDTMYYGQANYFAVTPEIVTNNNIRLSIAPKIQSMVNSGDKILLAPTGLDVNFKFPIQSLLDTYRSQAGPLSTVNILSLEIPADSIPNDFGIAPPENVLMILSSKKDEFFANNDLTDGRTSFIAQYNASTKSYAVSGMRLYFQDMLQKDSLTEDDYTFTITPVTLNYEVNSSSSYYYYGSQTSVVSSIVPYVAQPAMVKLNLSDAKIKLTFSKQSTSF